MKTNFFLCMRPPVIETDDHEPYVKLPPTVGSPYNMVSGKTSGPRNWDLRQRKRAAPGKYVSEGKSENPVQKGSGSPKASKITGPHILKSFSDEEPVRLNDKLRHGPKSNSGGYIMVSSLFFTMFFGKLVGIVGTLILVCLLCSHRKNDDNDIPISKNMVVNLPEKVSPEEYKKRVIMAGLLDRKNHYK